MAARHRPLAKRLAVAARLSVGTFSALKRCKGSILLNLLPLDAERARVSDCRSALLQRQASSSYAECPICQRTVPPAFVNAHVSACLLTSSNKQTSIQPSSANLTDLTGSSPIVIDIVSSRYIGSEGLLSLHSLVDDLRQGKPSFSIAM
jgi:hypothetical protein